MLGRVAHPEAMVGSLRDRMLVGPAGTERPFTADEMRQLAASVDIDHCDLSQHCGFKEGSYSRNRVHLNEHFELVVICWESGQASSIHDHGRSNCLYLVLGGEMTEEQFELGPDGMPRATGVSAFKAGEVTLVAGEYVHRINNRTAERLVTMHIYSPPLDEAVTHYTPVPTYVGK